MSRSAHHDCGPEQQQKIVDTIIHWSSLILRHSVRKTVRDVEKATCKSCWNSSISGQRSVQETVTIRADDTEAEWREEMFYLPGTGGQMVFDEELLQRNMNNITELFTTFVLAAREFAQDRQIAAVLRQD